MLIWGTPVFFPRLSHCFLNFPTFGSMYLLGTRSRHHWSLLASGVMLLSYGNVLFSNSHGEIHLFFQALNCLFPMKHPWSSSLQVGRSARWVLPLHSPGFLSPGWQMCALGSPASLSGAVPALQLHTPWSVCTAHRSICWLLVFLAASMLLCPANPLSVSLQHPTSYDLLCFDLLILFLVLMVNFIIPSPCLLSWIYLGPIFVLMAFPRI